MCSICLNPQVPETVAFLKDCAHSYCTHCIVAWAASRVARLGDAAGDTPCPQCKRRFTSLLIYRSLDGEVTDALQEESVVLLLRARWAAMPDHTAPAADGYDSEEAAAAAADAFEDEEEEMARFHRVRLLGNRRFGGGGHIAAGRLVARPVPPRPALPPPQRKSKPGSAEAAAPIHPQRAKREARLREQAAKEAAKEALRRERHLARLGSPNTANTT